MKPFSIVEWANRLGRVFCQTHHYKTRVYVNPRNGLTWKVRTLCEMEFIKQ